MQLKYYKYCFENYLRQENITIKTDYLEYF